MPELSPAALARALEYPYERVSGSVRYWPGDDRVEPVHSLDQRDLDDRSVVLAIGSNAAPVQLKRKFGDTTGAARSIPVLPATLRDHDVVFAALIASYGSIPATVLTAPGTTCRVHVTLLDPDQLDRMHATEGLGHAYELVQVDPWLVDVALLGRPRSCEAYVALAGALLVDGAPVALSAIEATGRTLPAWSQRQVLTHLATRLDLDLEDLVHRLTTDEAFRRRATEVLRGSVA